MKNKTISKLEENGKLIKNEKDILNAESTYYQQLFSKNLNIHSDTYNDSINRFIQNNSIEKKACNKDISEQENFIQSKKPT